MRQSKLFAKIKKEPPKEAEVISHKYLVRADFIEQSISGVYRFLPLGYRVLKKIERIIREEMLALGAEELYLPALQNKALWLETGRWQTIDPPLFKLKDRHQKETALGSTHEEEITDIVRKRIRSYQDLPLYLFQIQDKFRNEIRPSGGLLRTREFLMKDLYSFHSEEADLKKFYEKMKKVYFRIFRRCGLKVRMVEAKSGTIGGKISNEFMVISPVGEDRVLICPSCSFGINVEKAANLKKCPKCQKKLERKEAIEVGHIFNLGTKYSQTMGAKFVGREGKEHLIWMGCYGIGLPRLMAAIVETHHDQKGIIWPKSVAPFDLHLLPLESGKETIRRKIKKISEKLYLDLQKEGIEVLYDDREDKTAGEKFAEADLIGIPVRLVISERTLAKNSAEIKERNKKTTELIKINRLSQILNSKFKSQNAK